MAIEPKSKRQDIVTLDEHRIIREMIVESTQQNAISILGWERGNEYPGDPNLKIIELRTQYMSPAQSRVIATYSDHAEEVHDEDMDPVWTYSAETVTQMIYEDLDQHNAVRTTYPNAIRLAENDYWVIGMKGEGTESLAPIMNVTCRVYREYAEVQHFDNWLYITGRTNNATFHGMPEDYWLYQGFDAMPTRTTELNQRWEITHRFSLNPASWIYLWYPTDRITIDLPIYAGPKEFMRAIKEEPIYARIYPQGNFGILGLE